MRTRVLLIAPYPEMQPIAEDVAVEYPDLDLTVLVGDLESGVRATLSSFHANYDVIISRGGTAQALQDEVSLPVIEIELSAIDVIKQLRGLGVGDERIAAVGFANALEGLRHSLSILPGKVDLFCVDFADEVDLEMERVRDGGYDLVLCDMVSSQVASRMGLSPVLLESGPDSIRNAFERALFHCRYWKLERDRSTMLWEIAKNQSRGLVIYLRGGGLVFSNLEKEDSYLYPFLEAHLGDTDSRRLVFRHEGMVFRIRPMQIDLTSSPVVAFSIISHRELRESQRVGIDYTNRESVEQHFASSFFYRSDAWKAFEADITALAGSGSPLMLRGERGTCKEQLARLAYLRSEFAHLPFVMVDLELMSEKGMDFLINSHHSPLFEGRQTIFLRSIDRLPEASWRDLLMTILESRAHKRNLIIISANDGSDGSQAKAALSFSERLRCQVVEVNPLRSDEALLLDIADRYLAWLEASDGQGRKASITPEAQDMLLQARWPLNHDQLQKVLDRSYLLAEGEPIGPAEIDDAMRHARVSDDDAPLIRGDIDILKPLAQTEREIAALVVIASGGNKSVAARTLDISRTTLWRLLQDQTQ